MFEVDYGSGSVLGMEGVDNVSLAGLSLSQVLFGLVLYEDQQVRGLLVYVRTKEWRKASFVSRTQVIRGKRGYPRLLFMLPARGQAVRVRVREFVFCFLLYCWTSADYIQPVTNASQGNCCCRHANLLSPPPVTLICFYFVCRCPCGGRSARY